MQFSVKSCDLRSNAFASLVAELDAEMRALYPEESNHLDSIDELAARDAYAVGAFHDGEIVGCGAFKVLRDDGVYGEIKRIYVKPAFRGFGVARELLEALENELRRRGVRVARLETGAAAPEPLRLYENAGYAPREPFGAYRADPLSLFLEKPLDDS